MANEARRLRKSRSNKMIFGVAGGLAEYWRMDPAIIRALFILLAFVNGLGVVLYLILALIMPRGESPTTTPWQTMGDNVKSIPRESRDAARRVAGILRGPQQEVEPPEKPAGMV